MDIQEKIKANLNNVVSDTNFPNLGEKYFGKVRDCYNSGAERYLVTSDRISCFDRVVSTVPFKGQVLTDLACYWFDQTKHIFPNHLINRPDPNVMYVRDCEILPIEVILRGYLTGSAWRDYQAGKSISGIELPAGLKMSQKFPEVLITPSTKAPKGEHDLPISEKEILEQGIVEKEVWEKVKQASFDLFACGQKISEERGLILVDTKYEFGIVDGEVILADEIHTLDSSRYWKLDTYQERFDAGEMPEMLDKENVRQWLLDKGFKGDGEVPEIPDQYRIDMAELYINSYTAITGKAFEFPEVDVNERLKACLSKI